MAEVHDSLSSCKAQLCLDFIRVVQEEAWCGNNVYTIHRLYNCVLQTYIDVLRDGLGHEGFPTIHTPHDMFTLIPIWIGTKLDMCLATCTKARDIVQRKIQKMDNCQQQKLVDYWTKKMRDKIVGLMESVFDCLDKLRHPGDFNFYTVRCIHAATSFSQ